MNKNFIRIIPKLDIKNGILIKGINLDGLRVLGEPFNFAKYYFDHGADEIFYLDNVVSLFGSKNYSKFIKKTAKNLFIPLSVGGGIKNLKQIEVFLNNGADKVAINSAVINNLNFLKECTRIFGSSTITTIIQTTKIEKKYFITKDHGREVVNIDPISWSKKLEDCGAGEIFLTSINHEGLQRGFDIEITRKISENVKIPVIANGGGGSFQHVLDVIKNTNISGVSLSSFFHYDICGKFNYKKKKVGNTHFLDNLEKKKSKNLLLKLKKYLFNKGINVRYEKNRHY